MNKYKVFFQWNGKKQAMFIEANSKDSAESILYNKLQIDEVRLVEGQEPDRNSNIFSEDAESVDFLKGIFKMK